MINLKETEDKISSILLNNPNDNLIMMLFMLLGGIDDNFRIKVLDKITDEMRSPSGRTDKQLMKDTMTSYLNSRIKN